MNRTIQVLSEDIINQIAAGEVVERPYSVVKELVENSLDAQATSIFVTLRNGGRDSIAIWDNGWGMSAENLERAILRHATSKIISADDLTRILSKGFRGEALAAISSVSKVEIISSDNEKTGGNLLRANAGNITEFVPAAFHQGTRVTVENLFFNTPARRRFLKNEYVELRHICDWIIQIGINYPQVHFRLINNGKTLYDLTPVTEQRDRIAQCIGTEYSENLLPFTHSERYLSVSGLIGEPASAGPKRRFQFIYVNDRFVKERTIAHAVYEGYKTLLMKNRHPVFFLRIRIDPAEIDVNVHPSKTEIRVRNASLVHTIVAQSIRSALKQVTRERMFSPQDASDNPSFEKPVQPAADTFADSAEQTKPFRPFPLITPDGHLPGQTVCINPDKPSEQTPGTSKPTSLPEPVSDHLPENVSLISDRLTLNNNRIETATDYSDQPVTSPFSISSWTLPSKNTADNPSVSSRLLAIGELGKFIIAGMFFREGDKELVIIDKHAAHERIRYEEIRQSYYNGSASGQNQKSLVPQILSLSPRDSLLLEKDLDQWQKLGFDIENFGRHTFKISAVPIIFSEHRTDVSEIIKEIINDLADFGKSGRNEVYLNRIFERMACHSSIRGEQSLSNQEMQALLDKLTGLDINLYCPHGRPVMIRLSGYELEKRFRRIV